MDPITQGALGAAVALAILPRCEALAPIWGVQFQVQGVPVAGSIDANSATDAVWVNQRSQRRIGLSDLTKLWFGDGESADCF